MHAVECKIAKAHRATRDLPVTALYNIAQSCQNAPLSDRPILKQAVRRVSASVVGRPHSCFLLRISDKQRVAARETLRNATMTCHSATQNCMCKPAGDRTLLWVGGLVFGASLIAWHHLTHWRKAVKVEDGTADDRLSDVLITYQSATQHCICEPAGDLTLLWVGASVFGASLVAWHHLTHSRTAVKVEHGGAGDRL